MKPVEYYVALHEAECAVLDCSPEFPESISLLNVAAYTIVIGLALTLFVLTGLSRRLSVKLKSTGWRGWLQDGIYGAALTAFVWLACLPVGYWKRFALDNPGVSIKIDGPMPDWYSEPSPSEQRWNWFSSELNELPLLMLAGFVAAPVLLLILRAVPRFYWLLPALGAAAWIAVDNYSHAFDTIRPMPGGALAGDIAAIAEAADVSPDRVYLGEAHVMKGLDIAQARWHRGRQVAIVGEPYLNTLPLPPERYNPPYRPVTAAEARAVAAHEIAHVAHNHLVILPLALTMIAFLLAWLVAVALRRRGLDGSARTSLPIVLLAFGAALCAMMPVRANLWRVAENQADATALDIGRDPHGFALAMVRLARGKELDWLALTHTLLITHPDPLERIERAARWSRKNEAARWNAKGFSGPVRHRTGHESFKYVDGAEQP